MRILLITPFPPALGAGGAMPGLFHAQMTGLVARHDVCLVTAAGPEQWEIDAALALRSTGWDVHTVPRHTDTGLAKWVRRLRLAVRWAFWQEPWRAVWYREPRLQHLIDEILQTGQFDIVAVEDNSMGIYRLPDSLPRVLTEIEVRRPPTAFSQRSGRAVLVWLVEEMDWRRWRRYQRKVWLRYDAVQVFGDRDAALAVQIAPEMRDRIHLTPFGVTLNEAPRRSQVEPSSLAFVGNFTHPPNVDAAIWLAREILPRVRQHAPDVRLRIAGPHAPSAVAELRHLPGVEVLGYVDDVDAFLTSAAVVVAPVRIGGGMRMKVLHAMSLGRPVVTTTRGMDGLIGSNDAVGIGDTVEELTALICELLDHPDVAEAMGRRAGIAIVENHDPHAYAKRLEQSYLRTIDRHGAERACRSAL